MKEIKAKEGFYLSDKEKTTFFKSIKGANVNEGDYIEVEEAEAEGIIKHDNAIRDIDSVEKIDEYSLKASVIPECINNVPMSNKDAVLRMNLFPGWDTFIGKSLEKVGFKVKYNNKLYEIIQPITTVLEHQTPDLVPANYGLVSEHDGTKEDPIPYERMMVIKKDKYYTQDGVLYIGIMDAPNGYDADLKDLPTIAEKVE